MSQYKYAEIVDTVYFWFAANTTAGAAGDGASPLYDVRLAGAAADAAPTASGTPTLLTSANYTDGLHEIAIDTTGYAAGEYAVFCTLTISTVNPAGFCGSFKLRTAGTGALKVDAVAIAGTVQSATDLKDFADTGYDPATHKVAGVVLADGCTANSDMRGTDNAALASVLGTLADVAADGDPTDTDTLMKYAKQLINILIGTAGIATFPAEAAPGDAVSLAEVIRAIHTDTAVIGALGAGLTGIPWNASWDAEVQSEVLDALIATGACGDGDTLAAGSVGETLRWLRHFAKNEWRIDEVASPDTFKIYKDNNSTESYGFTIYTSSSVNYRDPV